MTEITLRSPRVCCGRSPVLIGLLLVSLPLASAVAQVGVGQHGVAIDVARAPFYVVPLKPDIATLYHNGEQILVESEERWRFMCGSDWTGRTVDDLKAIAEAHYASMEAGPVIVVDSGTRGAGINIVYNTDGSVPAAALDGFAMAEAHIESKFSDPITVTVACSFASMGGGILGATSSSYINNQSWANSRDGLQAGVDADDVIQAWLPAGDTIPVRYNGSSDSVSDATVIDWTRANFNATVGSISGSAGSMTYNSDFSWDYDPSNGVGWTKTSFVDVVVHETGHALGFTSAVDFKVNQMEAMDILRFQRTDGSFDYNPDTYAEFQVRPRLVDKNNPNDQHICDIIDFEWRMEDGNPNQASHWRQNNNYGIMVPQLASGSTRYPNFYSSADLAMFDALGYDYPPDTLCVTFLSHPADTQTICEGDDAQLSVSVENPGVMDYQWRKGGADLVDDGSHIIGANTDTLTIAGFTAADAASDYDCLATNTSLGCSAPSFDAELLAADDAPVILQQPQDLTVTEGDAANFVVVVENGVLMNYQWRFNGTPLTDDGRISGSTTQALSILPSQLSDAGQYDCVVTAQLGNQCSVTSDPATLTVNGGGDTCPEDLDGDGSVGLGDLGILLANYGQSGMGAADGDLDGDGDVDLSDLGLMLAVYGQDCPTQ